MLSPAVRTIATAVATIAAMAVVLSQCRRPWSWLGRLMIGTMNVQHAAVTRWGLSHIAVEKDFTVLDVGCGGGKTVEALARAASAGTVVGVDYSRASVAFARKTNAAAIAAGRVEIQQASVSALPFAAAIFDLVSAVETHYYWPRPLDDLREIARVLKPGGRLVLIAETYKGERFGALVAIPMTLLRARYLTLAEHRELLTAAGFGDVVIHEERRRGWICAVGRKPLP